MITNRKEAKYLLPIIKAFSEGGVIQYQTYGKWLDYKSAELLFDLPPLDKNYRIKPESKYRPFANAEECWQEMQKHQPFGWVKCKEDGSLGLITLIISEASIYVNGIGSNSERTMRGFTFADGTPFGVKLEE